MLKSLKKLHGLAKNCKKWENTRKMIDFRYAESKKIFTAYSISFSHVWIISKKCGIFLEK